MDDSSFKQSRAEDRAMIQAVVHRYAHTAREKMDFADMLPLFAPDARIVLTDGTTLPPAELRKVLRGEEASFIRHHVTTVDIRFTGIDEANSDAFFVAITNEAVPDHWGCWHDIFKRQPDESWLIQERRITVDGGDPGGWFARMYLQDD